MCNSIVKMKDRYTSAKEEEEERGAENDEKDEVKHKINKENIKSCATKFAQ